MNVELDNSAELRPLTIVQFDKQKYKSINLCSHTFLELLNKAK